MKYIKKNSLILLLLICIVGCNTKKNPLESNLIIPQPQQIEFKGNCLNLNDVKEIYTNLQGTEGDNLINYYLKYSKLALERTEKAEGADILQLIVTEKSDNISPEGYTLNAEKSGIKIESSGSAGLFYGIQSLLQLINTNDNTIPYVTINDSPRFPYRGMMLDVSRHFADKEFVKKQLDMMAYYKLNRFHWHLTDATGWRIEMKKYPQLTEKTAYRLIEDFKEWTDKGKRYCSKDTPGAYGGYYTQDDIKEIVAYAQSLHITVIPEVELPGHSEEVLAVFPELSCSGKPYVNGDFCIGNEESFTFLENILTEIMELFPSEYIHIGGDEAVKNGWKTCSKCKQRMISNNMTHIDELQSYMVHRIELFLNKNGRKMLGWDEILEGGLAPNATVMSWRGEAGGIEAAKAGHDVVMTPNGFCYFDSYQAAPPTQPEAMSGFVPIRKVYSYNPISDKFTKEEAQHIIGVQANIWTEYIHSLQQTEYMIWPRLLALAEVAWTQPQHKSFDDFHRRVLLVSKYLRAKGYNIFDLETEVEIRPEAQDTLHHLALGKEVSYNTDFSPKYKANDKATLTDGLRGDWSYSDGRWQGFIDCDIDVVIDLDKVQTIQSINATFMQEYLGWIWMPAKVEIYVSNDNKDFSLLKEIENDLPFEQGGFHFRDFGWQGKTDVRYVRYVAKSSGKRVGGWLFTDEIIIK